VGSVDTSSYGGSSLLSGSLRSQKVAEQVKKLDAALKAKLAVDFNSVRKAFLAIDDNHGGFITAETLAKYLGASKQKNFDFTLLEILIKLNTKGRKTRINYTDFVSWLGGSIEPTETFYFRHDSKKNPQFEVNLQRNIEKIEPSQQAVSSIITKTNLKEKLIERTFSVHKSLKSLFDEWRTPQENYVSFARFHDLIGFWGFVASAEQIREVFEWLDSDKDGKLSFEDVRETIGLDVAPKEGNYFRQNVVNSKSQPCNYPSCWENTLYNNRSSFCPLHQKIMKNACIDLFNQISQKLPRQEWELFSSELIKTQYRTTLGQLSQLLEQFTSQPLTKQQMVAIFETFKVNRNIEDNPEEMTERLVNVRDLISARLTRKTKRIDDLIALQQEKIQM